MKNLILFIHNISLKVKSSEFNRNVAKVFSGTLLAQLIAVGISPILTRIYTPEDFSNLALYLSVVSILTVIATLKYDKAIILPKDDKSALALVVLSTIFTLLVGAIFFFLYFFFRDYIIRVFKVQGIESWLIFVPITILARALYIILNTWFNRKKEYIVLSKNRVFTSSINGGLKIFFQIVGKLGAFGLVLSEAISQAASLCLFGNKFFKENYLAIKQLTKRDIINSAKKYKSFPIYSLPADFLGIFSRELPVIMLSGYFGAGIVGFYMLSKRILDVPFTLLSTSVLEVFKQQATEDYHKNGNCEAIFLTTLKKLVIISIVPFLILYISAPTLFAFVFGSEWRMTGEFAQVLTLMYFFKFTSSPLTYVFYITNKMHVDLIINLFILIIVFSSIYIGYTFSLEPGQTLFTYSIGYSLVYIVYLILSHKFSKG